jgi:hypothetical protein
VTPAEARRVAGLELEGIGFMKESRRFYPNRELAAHLLGFAGLDNVGLSGLEATYDKTVRGRLARCSCRPTRAAGRSAGSSGRPPWADRSSSPSTSSCSTSPSAS